MKKWWLAVLIALPLAGQEQKPEEQKPAEQAAAAPAAAEASPVPAETTGITGSIDIGYRWRTGVGGSFDTYRSIVNLGQGPRLFGLDLTFESAARRWFDTIHVRGNNWGGDPYNTAHVDAERHDWYRFNFDYRNIAYFDFLPSYADPTAGQGIYLDQRSFDTHRRMSDFELDLMPGKRIVPYLAYSHDAGFGSGITDFVNVSANEYPVADHLRDKTDNFRGGVHIEMRRFHVTLEQGGTTFKDDQQVFTSQENFGGRTTPFFGEQLFLTDLTQAYGIRGTSIYSKALVTASPASWIDIFGQFLYSRPSTDVHYAQFNAGNFIDLDTLLFFTSELDLLAATAKQPHTTASLGFELRPVRKLRIIESWMTDRLHNASSAELNQILTPALAAPISDFVDRLVRNYNQQQIDVLFDLTSKITLRGGHRYVWGDADLRGALTSDVVTQSPTLSRQVGLAGFNYRAGHGLSFNVDFEAASGDRAYFRTSLQDYEKARVRARYQPFTSLVVSATFSVLNNQNPAPTIKYDFLSRDNSLALVWTPRAAKRLSLTGEYTRATMRSDITYLEPQTLDRAPSFYRDNAHIASGMADIVLPGMGEHALRLGLGGSYFRSSGSRPTEYCQPTARLTAPINKHVALYAEWFWYGFSEPFYVYEGFRTHVFATGLRLTR